jgi:hypothetical protein
MTIAQPLLPFLYNSLTFRVKQLNRQLEAVYGNIILRSSITWIAFPFASGSLAEFRVDIFAYNLYATILIYLENALHIEPFVCLWDPFCKSYAIEPGHVVVKHDNVL